MKQRIHTPTSLLLTAFIAGLAATPAEAAPLKAKHLQKQAIKKQTYRRAQASQKPLVQLVTPPPQPSTGTSGAGFTFISNPSNCCFSSGAVDIEVIAPLPTFSVVSSGDLPPSMSTGVGASLVLTSPPPMPAVPPAGTGATLPIASMEPTSEVPVPASAWLFGSAVAGLLTARRKA